MRPGVMCWSVVTGAALLALFAGAAAGQTTRPCDEDWGGDRPHFCEIRELTIPARGSVEVNGLTNGGVKVEAWDGSQIRIEARVQAWARSEDRARDLARGVRVITDGTIHAEGARDEDEESWAVSYHLFVPRNTDLSLHTHNGGVGIEGVNGTLRFDAINGGVSLTDVAGDVKGTTRNGGVHLELSGDRWQGRGVDVETTNGGIRVSVPERYSAHLETGTVNGGMTLDFPVTVQGRIGRRLSVDLGDGGAPIRVITTNGGVKISRR